MSGVSSQENITTVTTAATSPVYCFTDFSLTRFAVADSLIIPLRMFCSSSVDLPDIFLSCLLVHTLFCHHARRILPTKTQVSPAAPSVCPTVCLQRWTAAWSSAPPPDCGSVSWASWSHIEWPIRREGRMVCVCLCMCVYGGVQTFDQWLFS